MIYFKKFFYALTLHNATFPRIPAFQQTMSAGPDQIKNTRKAQHKEENFHG